MTLHIATGVQVDVEYIFRTRWSMRAREHKLATLSRWVGARDAIDALSRKQEVDAEGTS